jgi:hypothetical protein
MTLPNFAVPSWHAIGQAVVVSAYTAAMTFFAGLIGQGGGVEHWADWKIAVQAGIAAGLAFLGWTGYTARK